MAVHRHPEERRWARWLVLPWGMLALALVGAIGLIGAVIAAPRRRIPRAWAVALVATGLALLVVPVLVLANAEGLFLPETRWPGGG